MGNLRSLPTQAATPANGGAGRWSGESTDGTGRSAPTVSDPSLPIIRSTEIRTNFIAPRPEPLIREVPLSRLVLAPENVRKTRSGRRRTSPRAAGERGDVRSGLALYRPLRRRYRAWRGPGDLAGRKPGAAAAGSGADASEARGAWSPAVRALRILRRRHGGCRGDRGYREWNGPAATPGEAYHEGEWERRPMGPRSGRRSATDGQRAPGRFTRGCRMMRHMNDPAQKTGARRSGTTGDGR